MNIALEVSNLTKHYKGRPRPAVENISFKVKQGEFHAFIGANGAGKTTTIKSIIGSYAKYDGSIFVFGKENKTMEAKKFLGYIPEITRFPKGMKLEQFLKTMGVLAGLNIKTAGEKVKKILEELNMTSLSKKLPEGFSSGQKKKVLLAQALINDPKVIIMDEPAANLDPKARVDFFDSIKRLQKNGATILMSSHILSELGKYADSVTILDNGKIAITGAISDIVGESNSSFLVASSDDKKFEQILIENKVKYEIKEKQQIIVYVSEADWYKIQKISAKANVFFKKIQQKSGDLESLYQDYVIAGSVDTGVGGSINA